MKNKWPIYASVPTWYINAHSGNHCSKLLYNKSKMWIFWRLMMMMWWGIWDPFCYTSLDTVIPLSGFPNIIIINTMLKVISVLQK